MFMFVFVFIFMLISIFMLIVPDHDGGRPKQIKAWFLYTHMVYL